MKKFSVEGGKEALVIVAHPDDEAIWMGGFILKHRDLRWTILSLCRASDRDRAPKFRRVCEKFGATAIIEDLDDKGKISEDEALPIIRKLILKNIQNKKFDYLFTHGKNGEYGHPRHLSVNEVIRKMASAGELAAEQLLFFNYKKSGEHRLSAKDDSDHILHLTHSEFKKKKELVTKIYGFDPNGIDANYCTNPEAFKIFKQ